MIDRSQRRAVASFLIGGSISIPPEVAWTVAELHAEIVAQSSGMETLVELPSNIRTDGARFEIDHFAAVAQMFFNQVWAIADAAAQFQSIGRHFA